MKKLFIFAIASMIGGTALAQTTAGTTSTTGSPLKFGLKAGVNLPKYQIGDTQGSDEQTKSTTNFHVTGYLDAPLVGPLWIQPGISLQGKGGKIESSLGEFEQNTMWVEVPINFVGKIPLGLTGTNFFLGAGPYLGIGISGENKTTVSNTTVKTDVKFGDDNDSDLKGTDFGLNFMGGVQINHGFTLGAGYGLGLTDLRPTTEGGDGKLTNRVLSFSIGYSF